MPTRTIYVRDADVVLFDRAQDELGKSVSALFAEFLKERLGSVTESEKAVLELMAQIGEEKDKAAKRGAGRSVLSEFDEAEAYARRLLNLLRAGGFEEARSLWSGAQALFGAARGARSTFGSFETFSFRLDKALGSRMTDGFLHVVRTMQDDGNRGITVMFAPVDKQDGFMKQNIFKTIGEAEDFLRKVGIDPSAMRPELDRTNAASGRVSLPSRVIEIYFS
jgi:hypothetical protein